MIGHVFVKLENMEKEDNERTHLAGIVLELDFFFFFCRGIPSIYNWNNWKI